jgi:hypothetical protein
MIVVILGDPDSTLADEDFTAHGPFASKEAAQDWIKSVWEAAGADPLDTPIIVDLYAPEDYFKNN